VATLNPDAARPVDLHPYAVVCDPATGLVFSGHESGDILCWDVRTKNTGTDKKSYGAGCEFLFPQAHATATTTLCVDSAHPGRLLLSGSLDGDIKVWDVRMASSGFAQPPAVSSSPGGAPSGASSPSKSAGAPVQKIVQAHLGGVYSLQQQQVCASVRSSERVWSVCMFACMCKALEPCGHLCHAVRLPFPCALYSLRCCFLACTGFL
jgi:WD40 repeat protein